MEQRLGGDKQFCVYPHGPAAHAAGQDHIQGTKDPLPAPSKLPSPCLIAQG